MSKNQEMERIIIEGNKLKSNIPYYEYLNHTIIDNMMNLKTRTTFRRRTRMIRKIESEKATYKSEREWSADLVGTDWGVDSEDSLSKPSLPKRKKKKSSPNKKGNKLILVIYVPSTMTNNYIRFIFQNFGYIRKFERQISTGCAFIQFNSDDIIKKILRQDHKLGEFQGKVHKIYGKIPEWKDRVISRSGKLKERQESCKIENEWDDFSEEFKWGIATQDTGVNIMDSLFDKRHPLFGDTKPEDYFI